MFIHRLYTMRRHADANLPRARGPPVPQGRVAVALEAVGGAAGLAQVHADVLDGVGDAQHLALLEEEEHGARDERGPRDLGEQHEHREGELLALAVEEAAARTPRVCGHGEEGGGDASPEAAAAVHGEGVEWVINLELELEPRSNDVDETADDSDDHRVPRQHGGTARVDRDQPGENAVTERAEVPHVVELLGDEHHLHACMC
eukprot:scaffold60447_cov36-Phaeocystis_antarctica.AAC.1